MGLRSRGHATYAVRSFECLGPQRKFHRDAGGKCLPTKNLGERIKLNRKITKQLQKKLMIEDPWLLVHRVDLHNALREKAEEGFAGKKPKIHLSCAVDKIVRYHLTGAY